MDAVRCSEGLLALKNALKTDTIEKTQLSKCKNTLTDSVSSEKFTRNIVKNVKISDEEAFRERLSTFTSFMWSLKPRRLSPLVFVRYGWKVVEKDMVQCTTCGKLLCAKLPLIWSSVCHEETVKTLDESIKEAHHKFCPWPFNPSPQNLLEIRLSVQENALSDFVSRLQSLCNGDFVLCISFDVSELVPVDEIRKISECVALDSNTGRPTLRSVLLALTGWTRKPSSTKFHCEYCLRNADSYFYKSANGDANVDDLCFEPKDEEKTLDEPPGSKKRKSEVKKTFCPLDEHQKWCPWIDDSDGQCPGWKRLLRILGSFCRQEKTTAVDDKLKSPRTGVLSVKRILKDWIVEPGDSQ